MTATAPANHPLATRMAAIAFCTQNITMGAAYGTFGVMLTAAEARLGVTREIASLGLPLVMAALALTAPIVGLLSDRFSARLLMIVGSLLGAAGYLLLALSHSAIPYLLAYALLIGPNVSLSGVVMPSTIVTVRPWVGT